MLTRKVNPRVVMFLDVILEDESSFDIFSVSFVFGDQYRTLLSIQFECKLGARFYGAFLLTSVRLHRDNHESYQGIAVEVPTSAPISLTVLVRR